MSEKNPYRGQQEAAAEQSLPSYDPSCYLCPGNTRAQGDVNPKYKNTFTFVNDYSAVKEDQKEYMMPDRGGGGGGSLFAFRELRFFRILKR